MSANAGRTCTSGMKNERMRTGVRRIHGESRKKVTPCGTKPSSRRSARVAAGSTTGSRRHASHSTVSRAPTRHLCSGKAAGLSRPPPARRRSGVPVVRAGRMRYPPLVADPGEGHEAALLRLARLAVDEKQSLERIFAHATKLIACTLGLERVGIWLFEQDRRMLRCVCLYQRSADTHGSGQTLNTADVPAYAAALETHRAIVADDARTDPATRDLRTIYLEPLGITSMLDAPLLGHGEVVGVVCHEHVGPPRQWTDAETSFAASVADIVALAMEQAAYIEARRELDQKTRRLEEERRMASIGRLAAAVAHDFNNLITIVLTRAQKTLGIPNLPEAAAEHARVIVDAVRRSRELTRQLAELGRGPREPPEPLALDTVVGAAREILD